MNREKYITPEMEIILFETEDIITLSDPVPASTVPETEILP